MPEEEAGLAALTKAARLVAPSAETAAKATLRGLEDAVHARTGATTLPIEGAGRNYDELVRAAQNEYPLKANKKEFHHIAPKYLGGPEDGATVELDAAYHQWITNEFRHQRPYGLGADKRSPPSSEELQAIMRDVYSKYPLPPESND